MITAVDTSVLIDIFGADARFGKLSANALRSCLNQGTVVANEVVWSETRSAFGGDAEFAQAMQALGIVFAATSQASANLAGRSWQRYRAAGGTRQRVIADFLIGSHAKLQCDRLLTRDRGYVRKYFAALVIVEPGH
jgi:predicted nucleic acid-binding protein